MLKKDLIAKVKNLESEVKARSNNEASLEQDLKKAKEALRVARKENATIKKRPVKTTGVPKGHISIKSHEAKINQHRNDHRNELKTLKNKHQDEMRRKNAKISDFNDIINDWKASNAEHVEKIDSLRRSLDTRRTHATALAELPKRKIMFKSRDQILTFLRTGQFD